MAAGNQLEKGIWALFVIAARVIKMIWIIIFILLSGHIFMINQCPWFRVNAIVIRRAASPTRLEMAVISPAARDLLFW